VYKLLKRHLKKELTELLVLNPDERIDIRINKYSQMGVYARKEMNEEEKVKG